MDGRLVGFVGVERLGIPNITAGGSRNELSRPLTE